MRDKAEDVKSVFYSELDNVTQEVRVDFEVDKARLGFEGNSTT